MTDHQYRELGPSYGQQLEDRLIAAVISGFAADPEVGAMDTTDMARYAYGWIDAIIAERDRRIDRDADIDFAEAKFKLGDLVEYRTSTIHGPSTHSGTIAYAPFGHIKEADRQYMVEANGQTIWKLECDLRRLVPVPDLTPLDCYPK